MATMLKFMGAALGVLVPYLFWYAIRKGIDVTPFDQIRRARLRKASSLLVWGWTALVWICSLTGLFSFHEGDMIPRFLLPLLGPVLLGLALLFTQDFRTILDHTPLPVLAGVQAFRFAGVAFFMITQMGILPMPFISGGYGDIITGVLALLSGILLSKQKKSGRAVFLAFSAVGLIDLLNVAYLLLKYYPTWYDSVPNSAPAADFSLIMIPAIAAPVALLLHVYGLRNLALQKPVNENPGPIHMIARACH